MNKDIERIETWDMRYSITNRAIQFACGCVIRMINLDDQEAQVNSQGYAWEQQCAWGKESSAHRQYPASTATFENLLRHRQ